MRKLKTSKFDFKKAIIGWFFAILGVITLNSFTTAPVFADEQPAESNTTSVVASGDNCQKSLAPLGWLVCPTTGKISEATDWLYNKIEDILVIDPVHAKDGSPIYEIWKYCRGITNIVFIIFFLIVIYSQITGFGISNYGIKKALPKLIVVAIMVNLSFLICQIAVDLSNIIGSSLREVFDNVQKGAVAGMQTAGDVSAAAKLSYADMYRSIAAGTALTVGGAAIAIETGAIWMLIPTVLGALVAVASGLITIAMRQAVVALLIMISPLAIVAYMLPNTENLFQKWKRLFTQMLVFYPMFSLLFGASSLAGFAIIASAKDGFGILLGTAVQVFPLFFSWSLMKMSGSFLGTVNAKINSLASRPLAANRAWADSHRQNTKQKYLASPNAYTPSLKLRQFLSNRRIAREDETAGYEAAIKNRGLAYRANRHYRKDGTPTMQAERDYRLQADNMAYERAIMRDKNNFNKGIGYLATEGTSKHRRLDNPDNANMNNADFLKVEQARGERIDYANAKGFHERMEKAIDAHMDATHRYTTKNGRRSLNTKYKPHLDYHSPEAVAARTRYNTMSEIMEGDTVDIQYAAATSAHIYDTQKKIVETKMQKYFEFAPPTADVVNRLNEFTTKQNAAENIDDILPGLRILNQRGDTDLVRAQLNNVLGQGVDLGSHASQALASFLMFEVKDNDPWLRRFGKYINLETARAFNANDRQEMKITYDEYIKGYHIEPNGQPMYAKKAMKELMEGTSLDGIERTALGNFDDSLIEAYTTNGKLNIKEYFKKREEIQTAIGPQFISASLKYDSGSEQLKAAVKFLTGYEQKQAKDPDTGDPIIKDNQPVYEWVPMWETNPKKRGPLADDPEYAKKKFREKALQYFEDQTPTQILGMRSDYRDPLMEHLIDAWKDIKEEDLTPEELEERRADVAELSRLQTEIAKDTTPEDAREKYEKAAREVKMRLAGHEVRRLLDNKGKLTQIYNTRRSGAANNAKDWMREWLNLDNEVAIETRLAKEHKRPKPNTNSSSSTESGEARPTSVYSKEDRINFRIAIENIYNNYRAEDKEVFYTESLKYLDQILSPGHYITHEYKKFHDDDPYADAHMLKDYLKELLVREENY
ncbi:hypothetical protein IKF57_00570 [Candidatus Saccharibacteria bacterium]|nr:hypothetical protein [Candidatus Saccharibacteria bacterium]